MSSTPPSLVMFAANEASVITGSSTSRPTSDHVPTLTKTESGRRKGTAATAEPVSWVATATTSDPSRCVSSATGSLERAEARSGLHDLGQESRRDVEPLDEVARPAARPRVEALRRAGVRPLRAPDTAEPRVHQVRDQQDRVGDVERGVRLVRHGRELEDRVDREQLDARAVVELPRGDPLEHAVDGPGPTTVPVVDGIPQQAPGTVDEPEVDRPRVDTDRGDRSAQRGCRAQPVEHLAVEAEDVPVKGVPQPHRARSRSGEPRWSRDVRRRTDRRRPARSAHRGRPPRTSSPAGRPFRVRQAPKVAGPRRHRLMRTGVGDDHLEPLGHATPRPDPPARRDR